MEITQDWLDKNQPLIIRSEETTHFGEVFLIDRPVSATSKLAVGWSYGKIYNFLNGFSHWVLVAPHLKPRKFETKILKYTGCQGYQWK